MKMKINVLALVLLSGLIALSSCNKNRTYAQMIKEQKRAIDRLIVKEGFEITKKYPANGVFGEKEFVLLDNGIYLNIVDSGNGNRPVPYKTTILMRCSGKFILDTDTGTFDLFDNYFSPIEFTYGYSTLKTQSTSASEQDLTFLSVAMDSVLNYVGENSIVKLIVPFDIGSSYQASYGAPLYYDKVKFTYY
ncbi:MAG: DUF4827 domain-containing protein [Tannerella sp.]|jgi:hypothetical protein|nr:DUF4827 domain-containing protein [Tannerella sp.]